MECPYCRAANRDGISYCGSCGKFIASNASSLSSDDMGDTVASSAHRSPILGACLQGGRYIVKDILGQGGMGAALLATDVRLDGKLVVIKELISESDDQTKLQEDVRNFKREV